MQAVGSVRLSQKEAITYYEKFVQDGIALGRRPELVGDGLVRSVEDWFQVLSLRRKGIRKVSKARRLFCQLAAGKMGYPGKRAEMATMVLETTL